MLWAYDRVESCGSDRLDNRRRRLRVLRPLEYVGPDLEQGVAETHRLRTLPLGGLFVCVPKLPCALTRRLDLKGCAADHQTSFDRSFPRGPSALRPAGNSSAMAMEQTFGL